jgi:hypothetical protein
VTWARGRIAPHPSSERPQKPGVFHVYKTP